MLFFMRLSVLRLSRVDLELTLIHTIAIMSCQLLVADWQPLESEPILANLLPKLRAALIRLQFYNSSIAERSLYVNIASDGGQLQCQPGAMIRGQCLYHVP